MRYTYTYRKPVLRRVAVLIDVIGYVLFSFRRYSDIPVATIRKILVVRPDHIGDNFVMTPFVAALSEVFPDAVLHIMAGDWSKPIWGNNPSVEGVVTYNNPRFDPKHREQRVRGFLRAVRDVRYGSYDLFVDPRGEPLSALIGFFARVPYRAGFTGHEVLSFLYTHTADYHKEKNELGKYADVLTILNSNASLPAPRLYPTEAEREKAAGVVRDAFHGASIIALHLSSGAVYKVWPVERFADLVTKLAAQYPRYRFAVLGAPGEEIYYDALMRHTSVPVTNLIGMLSLRETYSLLSHAGLFIGNDSVLVHFAAAQSVPTIDLLNVAIGGAERGRPYGNNVTVITGEEPGHVCRTRRCPPPCPNMLAIPVERVFGAAQIFIGDHA